MEKEILYLIRENYYHTAVIKASMDKLNESYRELKLLGVDNGVLEDLTEAISHLESAKKLMEEASECLKTP